MNSLVPLLGAVMACHAASLLAAQRPAVSSRAQVAPMLLDSARIALNAGRPDDAVRMARRALRGFEEALRLAPRDAETAYLYAQAGLWLGGEEGEAVARRGLEHALELDPLYRDAWTLWLLAFRNTSTRRLRDLLEPFDAIPEVRARMAFLDIEDELYDLADRRLDGLLARDSTNPEWLAWRAQSAFQAGDVERGALSYARALLNAGNDTSDALWRQLIGIATADELRAWSRLGRQQRPAWLAAFWARRNPDLFAARNGRLADHFQRLRTARRTHPLVRPLVRHGRTVFDTAAIEVRVQVATGLDEQGLAFLRADTPAPLDFEVWTAQFAGGRPGATEIAVIASRGALAAALSGADGESEVRKSPAGVVMLETDPGGYTLVAHARDADTLGRRQLALTMRSFAAAPALSDLLLAPAWPAPRPARWDVLRRVGRTRSFVDGQALRGYAEVYGLSVEGGTVSWRASYQLVRNDSVIALTYDRDSPVSESGVTREVLDITPERLPPGSYVLRLTVTDRRTRIAAAATQISFAIR